MVSFDVYNLAYDALPDGLDFSGSDDEMSCGAGLPAINRWINGLINILFQLINWCSPSTSHRTPLGPESGGPTLHTHASGITRQSSSARRHDTNGKYFQKIFTILTRKYFSFHNHLLRIDGDQRHEHLRHDGARTPRELGGDVLQVW